MFLHSLSSISHSVTHSLSQERWQLGAKSHSTKKRSRKIHKNNLWTWNLTFSDMFCSSFPHDFSYITLFHSYRQSFFFKFTMIYIANIFMSTFKCYLITFCITFWLKCCHCWRMTCQSATFDRRSTKERSVNLCQWWEKQLNFIYRKNI